MKNYFLILFFIAISSAFAEQFKNLNFEILNNEHLVGPIAPGLFGGQGYYQGFTADLIPGWNLNMNCHFTFWDLIYFPELEGPMTLAMLYNGYPLQPLNEMASVIHAESFVSRTYNLPVLGQYSFLLSPFLDVVEYQGNTFRGGSCLWQVGDVPSESKSLIFMKHGYSVVVYLENAPILPIKLFSKPIQSGSSEYVDFFGVNIAVYAGKTIKLQFASSGVRFPSGDRAVLVLDDIEFRSETLDQLKMEIKFIRVTDGIAIDWSGPGSLIDHRQLQVSFFADGPWETVVNAANPYVIPGHNVGGRFYRAVREDPRN